MATDKQIAASRANGAKSRGPATPEGKLRSARSNSDRAGLDRAMLARTVVLDGESRERFDGLLNSLVDELRPETAIESLLIHKMAVAHWRQMRLWGLEKEEWEKQAWDTGSDTGTPATMPANMNAYEMRFDRQFARALTCFEKTRARSRQTPESKPPEAPI